MPIAGGNYELPENGFAQPLSGQLVNAADAAETLTDIETALDALVGGTGLADGSVTTAKIADAAITLAKQADLAQATIIGRASGAGTGVPTALSGTQATAILDAFTGDSGSGGVKGVVPAPASGDTAAGKFLASDGTWRRAQVIATDGNELIAALNAGQTVRIAPSFTSVTLSAGEFGVFRAGLDKVSVEHEFTVNLPDAIISTSDDEILLLSPNHKTIRWVGAEPISLTMTSVASITGSTGDWAVTYNVASSAGVSVGHILKTWDVAPLPLLNGDNVASTILRRRPLQGELMSPMTNLGTATISASGTTITWGGGIDTPANCLAVNDLITINGQTRQISIVGSPTTVSSAWGLLGSSAHQAVYVSLPATGTVAISGTAVTGTGTAFTTEAEVGAMMLVDGELIEITAVGSDTGITLQTGKTVSAGTPYSIILGGCLHAGAFEVTAVGTGTVTVRNRSRLKPPIINVTGGSFRAIKTVLKQTGSDKSGIKMEQGGGIPWIDKIAVFGPRSGLGMALNGRVDALPLSTASGSSFGSYTQHGYESDSMTGPDFAVVDFGINVFLGHKCSLNARMAAFCGAAQFNIWQMEASFANLRRVTLSGASSVGHVINAGATALITETIHAGNAGDGLRRDIGATVYGEAPIAWGNGGMNYRITGAGGFSVQKGLNALALTSGIYADQATGAADYMLIAAPRSACIDAAYAHGFQANWSWLASPASGNGINSTNSRIIARNAAIIGAGNIGVYAIGGGDVDISSTFVDASSGRAIRADNGARIIARSCHSADFEISGPHSAIDIASAVGTGTLVGVSRVNELTKDGGVILNGSASAGLGVAGIRPNGGSNLSFFKMVTQAIDCPSVSATSSATVGTVTVTGATTTSMTAVVSSNYVNTGLRFIAQITATDTVTITAVNTTASPIDPGNSTYTVMVFGATA